jgi:hypothetical protein
MITVKMKVIIILSFFGVVALFLFMSNHDFRTPEPVALCGKYNFNTNVLDSIVIFKNHTYKHKYITTSGKEYAETGKWNWNMNEIDFHDFSFYNNEGPSGGSGNWMSKVEETDNEVRLIYSSDDDSYYSKKAISQK